MNSQALNENGGEYFLVILASSYQIVFATRDREAARRAALSRPGRKLTAIAMPEDRDIPLGNYRGIPQSYTLAHLGEQSFTLAPWRGEGKILRWKATLQDDFEGRSIEGATTRKDPSPFAMPAVASSPDQAWWISDALYAVEHALAEMGGRENQSILLHTLHPDERTRIRCIDGQWVLLPF